MKKFGRSLVTFLIVIIILSIVVSFFMDEKFETVEIEIPGAGLSPQARLKSTIFAIPLVDVSSFNYHWVQKKWGRHYEANSAFVAAETNFMRKLGIHSVVFDMNSADLLKVDNTLIEGRTNSLENYYHAIHLDDETNDKHRVTSLSLSQVRFLSPEVPELNYASNSEPTQVALLSQMQAAAILLKNNENPYKDVVIQIGFVPAETQKNYGTYAPRQALSQFARNVFEAQRALYKQHPDNRVRVLLINSPWSANFQLNSTRLGLTVTDLITVYNELQRLNIAYGNAIPDYNDRIGIAIDASALHSVWLSKDSPYYKDASRVPITQGVLANELNKQLVVRDYAGNIKSRLLKSIHASYFLDSEKGQIKLAYNLPYTRTPQPRSALSQLKFVTDLFAEADIGIGNGGAVVLTMPRRELFPIIHRIAKPLAREWGLYLKSDGATSGEQLYSLKLLRDYMNINLR